MPPAHSAACGCKVCRMLRFIAQNCTDSALGLEDAARVIDVTANYASKLLSQQTGLGFRQHLNTCRVKKAATALHIASKSLCSIAAETGFLDVQAFIRVFKQYTGLTPGAYRQRLYKSKEK